MRHGKRAIGFRTIEVRLHCVSFLCQYIFIKLFYFMYVLLYVKGSGLWHENIANTCILHSIFYTLVLKQKKLFSIDKHLLYPEIHASQICILEQKQNKRIIP